MKSDLPILDVIRASMIRRRLRGSERIRKIVGRITSNDGILIRCRYGSKFLMRENYIDRVVIEDGYYESEVLEALLKVIPQNGIFWDVGANFGLHSVTLKLLRPDVEVFCFEPNPKMVSRILHNAEMNSVAVTVLCIGLGNKREFLDLHVVADNPGMSTFHPWSEVKYSTTIKAFVERGDTLIKEKFAPRPDVIKIDIEGGEESAFDGLGAEINNVGAIIVEGSSHRLSDKGFHNVSALVRQENTDHALQNYIALRA